MVRQIFKIRHITLTLLSIPLFILFIKRNFKADSTPTLTNKHDYNYLDLEYVESNLMELDQGDQKLVKYTRIKYLSPPSKLPYQLSGIHATTINHTDVFSELIAKWFKNKKNGIFVEAGAHTGAQSSHTLMLEIQHNWTGLLVECNPTLVPILRQRHRKAWIADVCLSPAKVPRFSNFFNDYNYTQTGRLETSLNKVKSNSSILYEVYSIPLYTLVTALGYKEIDFFALDVEGAEMEILLTIPFDLLRIKVLTVEEFYHRQRNMLGKMDKFLRENGMHYVGLLEKDRVYVHQSMIPIVGHDLSGVNQRRKLNEIEV